MPNSNCLGYAVSSTKNNRQMRQVMLTAQQKSHDNMQAMSGEIQQQLLQKQLLHTLSEFYVQKLYCSSPQLQKHIQQLQCLSFSEKVTAGDPEVIRLAIAKFLYSECGITRCNGNVLITGLNCHSPLQEILLKMLQLVTPASYAIKGENDEDFFAPFAPAIRTNASKLGSHLLRRLQHDPQSAAIMLLVTTRFKYMNIFGKQGILLQARKFDRLVQNNTGQ